MAGAHEFSDSFSSCRILDGLARSGRFSVDGVGRAIKHIRIVPLYSSQRNGKYCTVNYKLQRGFSPTLPAADSRVPPRKFASGAPPTIRQRSLRRAQHRGGFGRAWGRRVIQRAPLYPTYDEDVAHAVARGGSLASGGDRLRVPKDAVLRTAQRIGSNNGTVSREWRPVSPGFDVTCGRPPASRRRPSSP